MKEKSMDRHQAMKTQREAMMADMKAEDVELSAQVVKINNAPEDQKLGLMAAILTTMVEQRSSINARMENMEVDGMPSRQMGKDSEMHTSMKKGLAKETTE